MNSMCGFFNVFSSEQILARLIVIVTVVAILRLPETSLILTLYFILLLPISLHCSILDLFLLLLPLPFPFLTFPSTSLLLLFPFLALRSSTINNIYAQILRIEHQERLDAQKAYELKGGHGVRQSMANAPQVMRSVRGGNHAVRALLWYSIGCCYTVS